MVRAAKYRGLLFWNGCLGVVVVCWWIVSLSHTPVGSVGQGKHPSLKKVGAAAGPGGSDEGKDMEQSREKWLIKPLTVKWGPQRAQGLGVGRWC